MAEGKKWRNIEKTKATRDEKRDERQDKVREMNPLHERAHLRSARLLLEEHSNISFPCALYSRTVT